MKAIYMTHFGVDLFQPREDAAPGVEFVRADENEDLARECGDAELLIVTGTKYGPGVAEILKSQAKALRWIQATTVGTDKFTESGLPGGIIFTTAAGLKGRTVAEHGFTLLLALMHGTPQFERQRAAKDWARDIMGARSSSAEGKTLVVIGLGSIGSEIARKAKAFDMRVVAATRKGGDGGENVDENIPVSDLARVLPEADAVMPAVPLSDATRDLIGAPQLALMKPDSYVVNISRGGVVNEEALAAALRDGSIAGAGIDVFETEPLPQESPLWDLDNIILTPHVASTGGPLHDGLRNLVFRNAKLFQAGGKMINVVDL